jgi:hypothetical protein
MGGWSSYLLLIRGVVGHLLGKAEMQQQQQQQQQQQP